MIHPNPDINSDYNEPIDDEEFIGPEDIPVELSRVHSDDELEVVIKELLHNSKMINASDITVIAHNCNVKLSGSVRSQFERDKAEEISKLVHGVGEVTNEIIVKLNDGILPTDIGRNE